MKDSNIDIRPKSVKGDISPSKVTQNLEKLKTSTLEDKFSYLDEGDYTLQMVHGNLYSVLYKDGYFWVNSEMDSKYSDNVAKYIEKEAAKNPKTFEEAISNLSEEKRNVIKHLAIEEIVRTESCSSNIYDIEDKDIFTKHFSKPLEKLEEIHNRFFGIGEGHILSRADVYKLSSVVSAYGTNDVGTSFLTVRAQNATHSFVRIESGEYHCIYSNIPA